ncbi:MAG TPA: cell division protein ZapE, partial [Allosphingosinicella sp.]|nr:cell division protein ZapE [Allosphingosinicella sp.]
MTAVLEGYRALVAAGELKPDPDQEKAVAALDRLAARLTRSGRKAGLLGWFGDGEPPPGGVYLWGGVGRGKSMLMDLAFETIACAPKRRVHFHEFMLEVHERLRAERVKEEGDPILPVAEAIAEDARLLCFDEMVINNAADAMILSRLFSHLLGEGVTVITTSNRPPSDLYLGGLNRALFLPFIALIE